MTKTPNLDLSDSFRRMSDAIDVPNPPRAGVVAKAAARRQRNKTVIAGAALVGLIAITTTTAATLATERAPATNVAANSSVETISKGPLSARSRPSIAAVPGGILVWGGKTNVAQTGGLAADGAVYRRGPATWETVSQSPLTPREAAPTISLDRSVIVVGGSNENRALSDGAEYFPATDTWRALPEAPNCPTRLVRAGQQIYALGACSQEGPDAAYFDLAQRKWTALPKANLGPSIGAVVADGRFVVVGDGGQAKELTGNRWTRLSSPPNAVGIDGFELAATGSRIVAITSDASGVTTKASVFELTGSEWTKVASGGQQPQLWAPTATSSDGQVIWSTTGGFCRFTDGEVDCPDAWQAAGLSRVLTSYVLLDDRYLMGWGGIVGEDLSRVGDEVLVAR